MSDKDGCDGVEVITGLVHSISDIGEGAIEDASR